jgi:hypothetical protein
MDRWMAGQTNRRDNPTSAFQKYVNAPKNETIIVSLSETEQVTAFKCWLGDK